MGKISKGILGGFSGRVGNVVGAKWRGIEYIRSVPSSVKNPKSRGQVAQRTKFAMVQRFVRSILPVVQLGFKQSAGSRSTEYAEAIGYNLQHAVKGDMPNVEMDYPLAAIARGTLYGTRQASAEAEGGKLIVTWDGALRANAAMDDAAMVVAYNPERQTAAYDLNAGNRADGTGTLVLPEEWLDEEVETYLVFASATGKVSDSMYLGRHTVTGA